VKKQFLGFILLLLITVPLLSACDEGIDMIFDALDSIETEGDSFNDNKEALITDEEVEGLRVHFIDVGQGDSILMETEDTVVLIDAGDWTGDEVVPYLEAQGISKIDLAVGTHEHADHIGQLDEVINHFDVSEVWMPGNEHTSQVYERVLNAIYENEVVYHEPKAGENYDIGDIHFELYNPIELTGDYNDDSIVMKASYGDVSFMLTGDAEKRAEAEMVGSGADLDATILKAGHHGSNTSSTDEFVKAVSPEVVIMSYGKDNKYNHPNGSTLDIFNQYDVEMYGTEPHGTIIIDTDGKAFKITTEKEGTVESGD